VEKKKRKAKKNIGEPGDVKGHKAKRENKKKEK